MVSNGKITHIEEKSEWRRDGKTFRSVMRTLLFASGRKNGNSVYICDTPSQSQYACKLACNILHLASVPFTLAGRTITFTDNKARITFTQPEGYTRSGTIAHSITIDSGL